MKKVFLPIIGHRCSLMDTRKHKNFTLTFMFCVLVLTAPSHGAAYRTEDFIHSNLDYLKVLEPTHVNNDGFIGLKLIDPSNLKKTVSFSFPTRLGSVVYRHGGTSHFGTNPWGIALSGPEDTDPRAVQKAKFLEKIEMEVIFETWDVDDLLAIGRMQQVLPNFNELNSKPSDTLKITLPLKLYNQSLMRKKPVTLDWVITREKGIAALSELFPEKSRQKLEELKQSMRKEFGIKRFTAIPLATIGKTKACIYDVAITTPENPFTYNFAQIVVSGSCVIGGVQFFVTRTTYHDADDPREEPSETVTNSMNYIEEIIENTLIEH